ncbi:ParB/RepB/Spo0J family partition protein [Sphingobium sp. YR768]|nr:ParB/RepB/Spo0J family partition protein [Sphingobium sp. YR768]
MATAAKKVVETARTVMALSPNDILVGERLGAFWPDKAAGLGALIAQDGQIVPIVVRPSGPRARAETPWTLVAGHHRLEGVRLQGLATINAIVADDAADLAAIEAMENMRPNRSPIERACFVRAIADAAERRMQGQHEGLSQQQIAVRARWDAMRAKAPGVERDDDLNDAEVDHTAANFATVYGWQDATAEALGMSKRTIRDDLALYRALVAPFPGLCRRTRRAAPGADRTVAASMVLAARDGARSRRGAQRLSRVSAR